MDHTFGNVDYLYLHLNEILFIEQIVKDEIIKKINIEQLERKTLN